MYYLIKDSSIFSNWFCSTNHKVIGILYLFFGTWVAETNRIPFDLPFLVLGLAMLHIYLLHKAGSRHPIGYDNRSANRIAFFHTLLLRIVWLLSILVGCCLL